MVPVLELLRFGLSAAEIITNALSYGQDNKSVANVVESAAGALLPELNTIVGQQFPKVVENMRSAAAAVLFWDKKLVMWLQEGLNFVMGSGLDVDGIYGPATTAAVEAFQTRYGLKVDGWAGEITKGLLGMLRVLSGDDLQKTLKLIIK